MCLIITSSKGFKALTPSVVKDIYKKNGDGFGTM
jgi:hypothetical protein